jgi:4-diphosphocytidyl-2-C-methyl-D-erythritol kinase
MSDLVTLPARAKVNLFLRVLSREASGYHGIETLFCRLALADDLTAERRPGSGVTIEVDGADVGPVEENLAVRGAQAALALLRTPFAVHLSLRKRIPVGAGLGGGSADAAAALEAVNALAGGTLPRHELLQCAARLGADVAFCFNGASLALAWGRGERLLVLPSLPPAPVLLVTPPTPVRTAEAYGWVDAAHQAGWRRGAVAMDLEALGHWGSIARLAGNDFESVVFGRVPEVRAAFEALAGTRPLLCRMSGSGSTLFAVYRTAGDRDDAAMMLGRKHGRVTATETA